MKNGKNGTSTGAPHITPPPNQYQALKPQIPLLPPGVKRHRLTLGMHKPTRLDHWKGMQKNPRVYRDFLFG